ncbi:SagB family peptide dehydrogenase [Tenacibaculum amylolyticum]|uniref:SagB family peptide dehydrogenase n=1 Tax=Tenacibaculum amylolyticum TaxID=104269 RepID=UPI003893042A
MIENNTTSGINVATDHFKVSFKNEIDNLNEASLQDFLNLVGFQYQLKDLTFPIKRGLLAICTNSYSKNELGSIVLKEGTYGDLSLFLFYLSHLESLGAIVYNLYMADDLFCRFENMIEPVNFSKLKEELPPLKLSQFSFVRLINNTYVLESSIGTSKITLANPISSQIIFLLSEFKTIEEISLALSVDKVLVNSFCYLLTIGGFIEFNTVSEEKENLELWNFHDLLFHNRSRYGRHNYPSGATYRFIGKKQPKPIKKEVENVLKVISLEIPSFEELNESKKLQDCLDTRSSSREFKGLTLKELSTFLYRTLKIQKRSNYTVTGNNNEQVTFETFRAPYPSGGAIYELSFYITIFDCEGLESGFYYYNAFTHKLSLLQLQNKETAHMFWYANACTGASKTPPVLITYSADFERMFWKYESMAYAAILKHVGVVYQTMYLVATDMNIGGCALGNGNTEVFKKLTNNSPFKESSVGEFILGNKLTHTTS